MSIKFQLLRWARIEPFTTQLTTKPVKTVKLWHMYLPVEECSWEKSDGAVNKVISDYKSIGCVSIEDRCFIAHFQTTKRRRNQVVRIDRRRLIGFASYSTSRRWYRRQREKTTQQTSTPCANDHFLFDAHLYMLACWRPLPNSMVWWAGEECEDVSSLQHASCSVLERWWSAVSIVPSTRSPLSLDEKV